MSKTTDAGSPTDSLHGARVLDLASVGMGPFAIQTLGDMSANAIKIESPKNDVFFLASLSRYPGMGSVTAIPVRFGRMPGVVVREAPEQAAPGRKIVFRARPAAHARTSVTVVKV